MRTLSHITILSSLILLSACNHMVETISERQEQATEYNLRAQRAFQRGEYQTAGDLYGRALQLDVAIENVNGIAINMLNLAKVNLVIGNVGVAERYLDSLLEDKALQYTHTQLAAAAVQKSLLRLQQSDVSEATTWLNKAVDYCVSDCTISGVLDNARASIALSVNEADKALHWSEIASAENKNSSKIEYANSLRLGASARLLKNEPDTSIKLLEEALVIDKTLGLPEKIRQDLLLLAKAHEKLGHVEQSMQYRDRAARVASTGVR